MTKSPKYKSMDSYWIKYKNSHMGYYEIRMNVDDGGKIEKKF